MKTNKNGTVVKVNPKWKLDEETIGIVKEARVEMGLQGACDVVALWAREWNKRRSGGVGGEPVERFEQKAVGEETIPAVFIASERSVAGGGARVGAGAVEGVRAERVETPYQIEKKRRLEELRARLEGNGVEQMAAIGEAGKEMGGEVLVVPFEVLLNGERHRVREYKGRRVLEWVGESSTVMKKNLTPQEVVIYWKERVKEI